MSFTQTTKERRSTPADQIRRDLAIIAGVSAGIGAVIFAFGFLAFGAAGYPVSVGTIAGGFIGIGIDLGIVLGVDSILRDARKSPPAR